MDRGYEPRISIMENGLTSVETLQAMRVKYYHDWHHFHQYLGMHLMKHLSYCLPFDIVLIICGFSLYAA
jgi:hypothetical protein